MLDRLLAACFGGLAAAVAVYVAVRLVERVAVSLLVIAAIAGLLVLGWRLLDRRGRW